MKEASWMVSKKGNMAAGCMWWRDEEKRLEGVRWSDKRKGFGNEVKESVEKRTNISEKQPLLRKAAPGSRSEGRLS
jgi:hypothetical protein